MKIGFDAKRAYQNATGLGNYSRTLISSLASFYPQHSYYLYTPELADQFDASALTNVHIITPGGFVSSKLKALWRSSWIKNDLLADNIDLYHGLSHEIPLRIDKTKIKSIVTIHDLIFERFPHQYNVIDKNIYRSKFKYACEHANEVIAISRQTKEDLINFYKIPEKKISVCYQSCSPAFTEKPGKDELSRVKNQYGLPDHFFLYVGSVIERKNLLTICKALLQLQPQLNIPLVVIGTGGGYKLKVQQYIADNNLQNQVIFLNDKSYIHTPQSPQSFQSLKSLSQSLSVIYQLATCLIYPSIFEGFGIPILEALWSRLPVITSNISCMPETGGDAALYIDPYSVDDLAKAMLEVATNPSLQQTMKEKGWRQAQNFTPEKCAAGVMNVYLNI